MKSGQDNCYVQGLENMNEQDVNEKGWSGSCCYSDNYLCSVLFLDVLSWMLFLENSSKQECYDHCLLHS